MLSLVFVVYFKKTLIPKEGQCYSEINGGSQKEDLQAWAQVLESCLGK